MTLHIEPIYGFYHGQDPRTFDPDPECCTAEEMEAHKAACEAADRGEWERDDSGCHVRRSGGGMSIICRSSFGLGSYSVVMTRDGDYVRTATYDDTQREGEWEEDVTL